MYTEELVLVRPHMYRPASAQACEHENTNISSLPTLLTIIYEKVHYTVVLQHTKSGIKK